MNIIMDAKKISQNSKPSHDKNSQQTRTRGGTSATW